MKTFSCDKLKHQILFINKSLSLRIRIYYEAHNDASLSFLFFFDEVLYYHYFIIKEDLSWFKDHKIIKKFNVSDED